MNDPMKIIHKYKNNNKRIQYHIYIFLGDIVDEKCMRVLKKFKDLDFYTTLVSLDATDREILFKNYGEYWYEKFFNSYHINFNKETILKTPIKMNELKNIFGTEWITNHITNYKKRIETVVYNYETMVKEEHERKMVKKIIQKQQHEAEDIVDYTTSGKIALARVLASPDVEAQDTWCNEETSSDESDEYSDDVFSSGSDTSDAESISSDDSDDSDGSQYGGQETERLGL